jgi:hypothetical protein
LKQRAQSRARLKAPQTLNHGGTNPSVLEHHQSGQRVEKSGQFRATRLHEKADGSNMTIARRSNTVSVLLEKAIEDETAWMSFSQRFLPV